MIVCPPAVSYHSADEYFMYSNVSLGKLTVFFKGRRSKSTKHVTCFLQFSPYFLDLWQLFQPKLSEPPIAVHHNKQVMYSVCSLNNLIAIKSIYFVQLT